MQAQAGPGTCTRACMSHACMRERPTEGSRVGARPPAPGPRAAAPPAARPAAARRARTPRSARWTRLQCGAVCATARSGSGDIEWGRHAGHAMMQDSRYGVVRNSDRVYGVPGSKRACVAMHAGACRECIRARAWPTCDLVDAQRHAGLRLRHQPLAQHAPRGRLARAPAQRRVVGTKHLHRCNTPNARAHICMRPLFIANRCCAAAGRLDTAPCCAEHAYAACCCLTPACCGSGLHVPCMHGTSKWPPGRGSVQRLSGSVGGRS